MPVRDDDWRAKRDRAKVLVRVLAKFERNFNDPARRSDTLIVGELETLDDCATEARELLGDKTLVSRMLSRLEAMLFDAERNNTPLTFDSAYRYVGPILAAIEATFEIPGSPHRPPATKPGKNPAVVVRIEESETLEEDGS